MFKAKVCRALGLVLALTSTSLYGRAQISSDAPQRQRAIQELENVLAEANSLADKNALVTVKAKAAGLIWLQSRERARELFNNLWVWVNSQDDAAGFDREAARTQILKRLFVRDPKLASKLLKTSGEDGRGGSQGGGSPNVQRLDELASGLMEDDPSTAAGLLGESLSADTSPMNVALLERLRKRDVGLADAAAADALASLKSRPPAQAVLSASLLIEYIALTGPASGASSVNTADEALRRQFFITAYDALSQTLHATEQQAPGARPRADVDTSLATFPQAQLAGVLASLAKRYGPEHAAELDAIAGKLTAGIPPQLNELAQYTLDHVNGRQYKPKNDSPAGALSAALNAGDFEEARRLLGGVANEDLKKFYSYQIAVNEFKADMARSNFAGAFAVAKGVEDTPTRAYMFAQLIKASYKKGDTLIPQQALSEARITLAKAECADKMSVAAFALAAAAAPISLSDSVELLNGGTSCINSPGAQASGAEKDAAPPHRFLDSQELQQAFSSVGKIDLDNALLSAGKIDDKPTALVARLSACEGWLPAASNVSDTPLRKTHD